MASDQIMVASRIAEDIASGRDFRLQIDKDDNLTMKGPDRTHASFTLYLDPGQFAASIGQECYIELEEVAGEDFVATVAELVSSVIGPAAEEDLWFQGSRLVSSRFRNRNTGFKASYRRGLWPPRTLCRKQRIVYAPYPHLGSTGG